MQSDRIRKLVRRLTIPVVLVAILGGAAGYIVSRWLTPIYDATGRVLVVAGPGQSGGPGAITITSAQATSTAALLLTEPSLLSQVSATLGLNMTSQTLSREVSAVADLNTELVDVTVSDPSPPRAASIVNALMAAYVTQVTEANAARISAAGTAIQGQIDNVRAIRNGEEVQLAAEEKSGQDTSAVRAEITADSSLLTQLSLSLSTFEANQSQTLNSASVAESASVPTASSSPNAKLDIAAGAIIALLLALGLAYVIGFPRWGVA